MKYQAKTIDGKLMLISRDIQVGDKVIIKWENSDTTEDEVTGIRSKEMYQLKKDNWCYKEFASLKEHKVIGEISPASLFYVEEGQEFDLSELDFTDFEYRIYAEATLSELYEEIKAMPHYGQHERISRSGVLAKIKLASKAIANFESIKDRNDGF